MALLAPSVALACGVCTDMLVEKNGWWLALPRWAFAALLVDAVAFWVYRRIMGAGVPLPTVPIVLGLLVAIVTMGFGGGSIIPAAIATPFFGVRFARSVRIWKEQSGATSSRRLLGARIALVGMVFATMAGLAFPPAVPMATLLRKALYSARLSDPIPGNWMERELVSRPEAIPEVERRTAEELAQDPNGVGLTLVRLARLHFMMGGERAKRADVCQRWQSDRHGIGKQDLFEKVCAPATR